jgi:tetratricopeptide (TPR) repeat protein
VSADETVLEAEDAPVASASESTLEWADVSSTPTQPSAGSAAPSATPAQEPAPSSGTKQPLPPPPIQPPSASSESTSAEKVAPELLPWAGAQTPSPDAIAAVKRADEHVRRGIQLSGRGALYSARKEYLAALQLIAQSHDARQSTSFFSKALAAGLCALEESNDFVCLDPRKGDADVTRIVARHKTPVLKESATDSLTMSAAARRYRTFAQEQLAAAAGGEIPGSMALFGLGKSAVTVSGDNGAASFERIAEAMVLYEAAVLADPRNHRAANELAVLLAKNGNLPRARELLLVSVRLSSQSTTWHNLAVVHARLGETQLATAARAQAASAPGAGLMTATANVQWVDSATFAGTPPMGDGLLGPAVPPKPASPAPVANAEKQPVTTAKKSITDWLPWSTRRQ